MEKDINEIRFLSQERDGKDGRRVEVYLTNLNTLHLSLDGQGQIHTAIHGPAPHSTEDKELAQKLAETFFFYLVGLRSVSEMLLFEEED